MPGDRRRPPTSPGPTAIDPRHDHRHPGAAVEEWVFACWTADGALGAVSGHRALGRTAWYWAALVRRGEPLLHVTEWDVPVRSDPAILKAHGLWAEHSCVAAMEQWTVGNEAFAAALDDPADALGRAYGAPTAMAFDLEWYALRPPRPRLADGCAGPADGGAAATGATGAVGATGYEQDGVVHGVVELTGGAVHVSEIPARRWHRWGDRLGPLELPDAYAHTGLRAPFAFPDGTVADWVLTPDGWRSRVGDPSPRTGRTQPAPRPGGPGGG